MDIPNHNVVQLGSAKAQRVERDFSSYLGTLLDDQAKMGAVLRLLADFGGYETEFTYERVLELLAQKLHRESLQPDETKAVPFPFCEREIALFDRAVDMLKGHGRTFWQDSENDILALPAALAKFADYYGATLDAESRVTSLCNYLKERNIKSEKDQERRADMQSMIELLGVMKEELEPLIKSTEGKKAL